MEQGPAVSVIVPVYNTSEFLPHCLETLLSVPLQGLELILVDDGSTDGSLRVCREYAEKYGGITVLSQANAGPSAARNLGLRASRGEYIAFVDSDDDIVPEAFAAAAEKAVSGGMDILLTDFFWVTRRGEIVRRAFRIPESEEPLTGAEAEEAFFRTDMCYWNIWRGFYRRAFLMERDVLFPEGYHCAEDMLFSTRALLTAESTAFWHRPYYRYAVAYGDTLCYRFTLERVEQLLTMLEASAAMAGQHRDRPCAGGMSDSLAREYILSLTLCRQLPREERAAAYALFREKRAVLKRARKRRYRMADRVLGLTGFRAASCLLFVLKRIRQIIRKRR